jgi:hypothetical protein
MAVAWNKHVTVSGAFVLAHSDHDSLSLDQHYYCQSTIKDATDSGAFAKTPLSVTRLLKDATASDAFT